MGVPRRLRQSSGLRSCGSGHLPRNRVGDGPMRRTVAGVVLVLGLVAASPAAAQEYGGGRFPAKPSGNYTPTVGIVLQQRGSQMAIRFDTSVKCPGYQYEITGRKVVPFDGRSYAASGGARFA